MCYLQDTWEDVGKVVLPHIVCLGQLGLILLMCGCRLGPRLFLLLMELSQQNMKTNVR